MLNSENADRPLSHRVVSSVSWLAGGQAAQRLSRLVITAILARLLAPADFGLVSLTTIAVGLISVFANMGLTSALVQRPQLSNEHLASAFWLGNAASLTLAACGLALAQPIAALYREPRIAPLLAAMMLVLPMNSMAQVPEALLQRRLAFRQLALIEWLSSSLSGVIAIVLALWGLGVWALVAQAIAISIFSTCGRMIAAGWAPTLRFAVQPARQLLSFSLSALGGAVINFGMGNVDNLLVGSYLGVETLGYYALAYNLAVLPGTSIGGLVSRVMFPALSSVQNDLPRFRRGYLRMLHIVSSLGLPLVVGLGATAPLLIKVVYGERWAPAALLLQILAVVGLFEAVRTSGALFYALGRPNIILLWVIVSLLIMGLSFAVGVRWGAVGVAWSYVIISPLIYLVPHILANRLISLPRGSFLAAVAPALYASLIMGGVVLLFGAWAPHLFRADWANLAALVVLGGVVYALTLAAIGAASCRGRADLVAWLSGGRLA